MAQINARIDDELIVQVDRLIDSGVVASRSEAVRDGLGMLIDLQRRQSIATAIGEGYRRHPQTDGEVGWSDDATISMIIEEPW